ncbi:hypothetical protein D3273_02765 [Lichenibacterium minor]|uniref:Uncharacterized protein n=1 Tax=Lichenibacterium minor TaxID=2316528 RepID=A0A4V1RV49_9HYPH|nr:hypothetical protein [Lichenibacterium minor]RYC33414.1 hypothetical protein D3273_02765 [Lichenibacterium minor]
MILDVLVFALGFMVAGLLALAALPAVWRRALRLSEERLSRLVPLSPEEIAAERDHLRAAHAVALRRVEQRLDGSEAERAALRVEAARREARIAALDEAVIKAQVRIAARDAEVATLRGEVASLWAEHGAEAVALDGLGRLAERRMEEIAALQAERDGLRHEVDSSRGSLAGLQTRLIGAEARGSDLDRELAQARRDAAAERDTRAAEAPAPDVTAEIEALKAELAFMAEQAQSAERRATASAMAHEALKSAALKSEALKRDAVGSAAEGRAEAGPPPAAPRDDAALRAAVAALADEVLRAAKS